jgi:hypothetical protein
LIILSFSAKTVDHPFFFPLKLLIILSFSAKTVDHPFFFTVQMMDDILSDNSLDRLDRIEKLESILAAASHHALPSPSPTTNNHAPNNSHAPNSHTLNNHIPNLPNNTSVVHKVCVDAETQVLVLSALSLFMHCF